MVYILAAILIFGVLIAVHELGHFLSAKACGVRVNEFAIGMGPALWKKTKGETTYALRVLPVGGFCAMEGEDGEEEDENGQLQEVPKTTATFADWEAEIYPAEEEQIEVLRKLIAEAKPLNDNDAEILKIINEEAQAYFVGQKTAEDVAKIIQSRVSIFVSENG